MQTIDSLDLITVTVQPQTQASELQHLARAHAPRAVAVMERGTAVGVLNCRILKHVPPETTVAELMDPVRLHVDAGASVRRVAQEFLTQDLDSAVVVAGANFVGVVTTHMLLREVGRSWDPLTGLGWSDRLREWGISRLREGREISVLFLDLDDFGLYNKKFGHIVGDYVLQIIATTLKRYCEGGKDILVRYGGDEFAIGTLRTREDAVDFAAQIREGIRDLRIEDQPQPIGACIGIFGGRRSHERDHTHYAATMDNLINRASKECMSQKANKLSL